MTQIVQQLGPELKKALKGAEEVWIAVALMNEAGLKLINDSIHTKAKTNFILGISLPTHPKVFESLMRKELVSQNIKVSVHRGAFYHPKLYLIKRKNGYIAFIGSANATIGGYQTNIELSIKLICNFDEFQKIKGIIESYKNNSISLSLNFLEDYKKSYKTRQQLLKQEQSISKKDIENAEKKIRITEDRRKALIADLKKYKRRKDYSDVIEGKKQTIISLREALDYPRFNKIQLDDFFGIWDLGHLLQFPKPTILANMQSFKEMLRYLIKDEIPIEERYQNALKGRYHIRGVASAFISKVLTVHNPEENWVQNKMALGGLKPYGLLFPRGMTAGEKYTATSKFLQGICRDAKIPNMAVLDYFLYLEAFNNQP